MVFEDKNRSGLDLIPCIFITHYPITFLWIWFEAFQAPPKNQQKQDSPTFAVAFQQLRIENWGNQTSQKNK